MKISAFILSPLCASAKAAAVDLQTREYTPGENLALVDCGIGPNGGSTTRQMIYYSSDIWVDPTSFTPYTTNPPEFMVEVPWDGSYPWRSTGVSAITPDGDTWSVTIDPSVADPDLSGSSSHTYNDVDLNCWSIHGFGIYDLQDGTTCTTAYVCNHKVTAPITPFEGNSPPPPAVPHFSHNSEGSTVTLVGEWSIDRLFSYAGLHSAEDGTEYCSGLYSPQTLPGSGKYGNPDCTVAFKCGPYNADIMISVAKQVMQQSSVAYTTSIEQLDRCDVDVVCFDPNACVRTCKPGPDCWCDDEDQSRTVTHLGSGHVTIGKCLSKVWY